MSHTKPFSFQIPVPNKKEPIGSIVVSGVYFLVYCQVEESWQWCIDTDEDEDPVFEIQRVEWNGVDILGLLNNFDGAEDLLQSIKSACIKHLDY